MSHVATLTFHLPQGWTLRKVVSAMVQEWLPPFRAEPALKAARWVVQGVMEQADKAGAPLWEPGISTAEYEIRLDRDIFSWAIRATAGRGKGTILARLSVSKEQPEILEVTNIAASFPETLFDAGKLEEYLGTQAGGADGIFAALLTQNGFERIG